MTPLTLHPDATIVLPPRLLPGAAWYAAAAAAGRVIVDTAMRYDRRCKATHRYRVADVRGPLDLTVPVAKAEGASDWRSVGVSTHGRWWHVHRVTLESGYGRTPYFEFLIDRLQMLTSEPAADLTVISLAEAADSAVRRMLGFDNCVEWRPVAPDEHIDIDLRHGSVAEPDDAPPYFQVRAASLGFIPGLSLLDLLFNLGDEAPYYLQRLQRHMQI